MNKINLLKKYAYNYLSKYDSSKKNLEWKLRNKITRMKDLDSSEKNQLYKNINNIISDFVAKKIINDENYANTKIKTLYQQSKSELFIKQKLFKKGIDKKIINILLEDFEKNNPDWEINSAKKFAIKKKLGTYGNIKNKEKDISKMARAGFSYSVTLKALGFDNL